MRVLRTSIALTSSSNGKASPACAHEGAAALHAILDLVVEFIVQLVETRPMCLAEGLQLCLPRGIGHIGWVDLRNGEGILDKHGDARASHGVESMKGSLDD